MSPVSSRPPIRVETGGARARSTPGQLCRVAAGGHDLPASADLGRLFVSGDRSSHQPGGKLSAQGASGAGNEARMVSSVR